MTRCKDTERAWTLLAVSVCSTEGTKTIDRYKLLILLNLHSNLSRSQCKEPFSCTRRENPLNARYVVLSV